MYANILYNKTNSTIQYSHYDDGNSGISGKRYVEKEHFVPAFYVPLGKGETKEDSGFKSNDGVSLEEVVCETWGKRKSKIKYYKEAGIKTYGSDYSPENLFISEKYPYELTEVPKIKGAFCDIETECEDGFPDPHIAKERVNLITLFDVNKWEGYTLAVPYSKEQYGTFVNTHKDVKYKEFDTEEDMLKAFIKIMNAKEYDVISGWNSTGFDVPYLYNRIENVLGTRMLKKLAPFGSCIKREVTRKNSYGQMEDTYSYALKGLADLDYMLLYKKFEWNQKESYKLDAICEEELGEKKKEHPNNCSFKEFYRSYWCKFVDYNIQDVKLLKLLEEKKGYLQLSFYLSYMCKCTFPDNFGTVTKQETAIHNYLKLKKGIISDDDLKREERVSQDNPPFDGAYVKEPDSGMYEWVIDIDIASLYPSIIRMCNISPDTKLFQIYTNKRFFEMDDSEEVEILYTNDMVETRYVGELKKAIIENKYHISSNNTVYENKDKKYGVIPSILTEWYAKRKENKKESFKYHKESLNVVEDACGVDAETFEVL